MLRDDFSMLRKMFNEPNVPINVDIWLEEGNLFDLGNFRLNVMYTPGHTSACISLFDQDKGLLFAADTLMPGGVMGGVFGSGSISDYIQSLERLKGLEFENPAVRSWAAVRYAAGRCADRNPALARAVVGHRPTVRRAGCAIELRADHAIGARPQQARRRLGISRAGLTNRPPVCSIASRRKNMRENAVKLYDSIGPNPRIVRMFMAEKGIEMPKQTVDLRGGENRQAEHLKRNPHGQMPTLELDDGSYLSEITAICEYLEENKPEPPMIGSTPKERAECRMWTRRVDLNICEPLANGYRFGEALKFFEKRIPVVARSLAGAEDDRRQPPAMAQRPDGGRASEYLCGKRFTLADILLYCWLDFGAQVGQPLDPANTNIEAWFDRVGERPSVKADPVAPPAGARKA